MAFILLVAYPKVGERTAALEVVRDKDNSVVTG
jgi:hypothetical protein